MQIHFIFNADISPTAAGGATGMTHTLAKALSERGCGVSLGFFQHHPVPSPIENKIHITEPFNQCGFKEFLLKNKVDIIVISTVAKQYIHFFSDIYRIANEYNIKVIQWMHFLPGEELMQYGTFSRLLFAIREKKRIGFYFYCLFLTSFRFIIKPLSPFLLGAKYRLKYNTCDVCVMLSKYVFPDFSRISRIKNPTKLYAIDNSLTLDATIQQTDVKQKKKEVLIVARMDEPMKRISMALRIWKIIEKHDNVNDWTLTILGRGADFEYYKYLIKKLRLQRCNLAGFMEERPYKSASVFMMVSAFEGWGLTLTESQQMGVVPIAFDSYGTLHRIIQNGENGIIVPNNKIKKYAETMLDIMKNDADRERLATNALTDCQRFTLDKVADCWLDLFQKLLAAPPQI
jgi:glycosyltransferase involved in cell wall biosynthesis